MTQTIYSGRYAPLPDRLVQEAWQERTARYQELNFLRQEQAQGNGRQQGGLNNQAVQGQFYQDFESILSNLEKRDADAAAGRFGTGGQQHDQFNMGMVPLPIFHPGNLAGYFNQDNLERGSKRRVTPVAKIEA